MPIRHILGTALLLTLFAMLGTGLVAATYEATKDRIAANEREAMLDIVHALVPAKQIDNDLFHDTIQVSDPLLGDNQPHTAYRARKDGKPVAVVLTPIAPDGYGGPIKLLVAVRYDGRLAGVRVLSENETPGLGDNIEVDRSDWILQFAGLSLGKPPEAQWKVKKDGGVFDQFTGATITPRAVVKAIRNTLIYFKAHREQLFAPAAAPAASDKGDKTHG